MILLACSSQELTTDQQNSQHLGLTNSKKKGKLKIEVFVGASRGLNRRKPRGRAQILDLIAFRIERTGTYAQNLRI